MLVLVCLVSAQVRLPGAQGTLIGVLVALILASALLGMLLAARLTPSARISMVLNVPMRHRHGEQHSGSRFLSGSCGIRKRGELNRSADAAGPAHLN